MPLITQALVGATTTVTGMLNEQQTLTVAAGLLNVSVPLAVNQLPNITIVLYERAAVATPCSYTIEYAVKGTGSAVAGPAPDWKDFTPPSVGPTPVGIPLVINLTIPCSFVRLRFVPAGGITHAIELIVSATA